MIKIDKDLSIIPNSLNDRKTITRRDTLIRNNAYPLSRNAKEFNKRFKQEDTLNKLAEIYNSKCAYCEEKIKRVNAKNLNTEEEISHTIEHYRPKSEYPWLAYSWDNLLWCCVKCNKNKDNDFDIENEKVNYTPSFNSKIHNSTKVYNHLECPKMIHPELEDVTDKFIFNCNGNIDSNDERVKYTIKTCVLDRVHLNIQRKKIFDELKNEISALLDENKSIKDTILNFQRKISKNDIEFKAFHLWIDKNLEELIIKSLKGKNCIQKE